MGDRDDVDIDHVRRCRSTGQGADLMCFLFGEGHNIAATKKAPKLSLATGPTDLGNHRGGRRRHEAQLEAGTVICPHRSVGSVSGDQGAGVVDDSHADRLRARRAPAPICVRTRSRATASSASLSDPCSASHSATAASPSRMSNARRAALVIQAETLTPSAVAASMTRSCTSASTVMASFGDGFPLGTVEAYYRGRSEHASRVAAYSK